MIDFGNGRLAIRAYLQRFGFNPKRINMKVKSLSGGEKAGYCSPAFSSTEATFSFSTSRRTTSICRPRACSRRRCSRFPAVFWW